MLIAITGFLADASEDDSTKLKIHVKPEFEQAVMDLMGWESLETGYAGIPLTSFKAQKISAVIKETIPTDLDLYIGTRLTDEEVAERMEDVSDVEFLSIDGFYGESNPDESLQYEARVPQELESAVLSVLGWTALTDVPAGVHHLTPDEAAAILKILGDTVRDDVEYGIGICV